MNAAATQSIKKHQASYLIAVGGAAYLISKSIKKARKDGDEKAVKIWIRDFRSPYWKAKQEQLIWGYDEED
jgi:tartrate dehydratase beta subunit/fumarate hydratase class I family protein